MVSARMNPRSRSEWILPGATEAVVPRAMVQAFISSGPPVKKLMRAVRLSEENYCGVRATLDPVVEIRSEVYLNGERIDEAAGAE